MSRFFASHLSPAPVSTRIVLPAARIKRQFIASKMRLRSSARDFFSHIGFGITPNIAPPSRRSVPSFNTKNSKSPNLNAHLPVWLSRASRLPLNMDRAYARRLPLPVFRACHPSRACPPRGAPGARATSSTNVPATKRSLSRAARFSRENAVENVQSAAKVRRCPYFRSRLQGQLAASNRFSQAQAAKSREAAVRNGRRPHDLLCSTRKRPQFPSGQLSNSGRRRPFRGRARQPYNQRDAQFQLRPGQRRPFRPAHISFPPRQAAERNHWLLAKGRRANRAWPWSE